VAAGVCVLSVIGVLMTSNSLKAYLPWEDRAGTPFAMLAKVPSADRMDPEPLRAVRPAQLPSDPEPVPVAVTAPKQPESNPESNPEPKLEPRPAPVSKAEPKAEPKTKPAPEPAALKEIDPEPASPSQEIAVAQIQDDSLPQPPNIAKTHSELLGKLTVRRNETLSGIIQKVYGSYTSKYFRSLILANPLIDDPDRVEIGQTIALPAISANIKPVRQPTWWVQVDEKDSLEAAYDFLRSYPTQAPPIRMIPYWTSGTGIRFVLVLKETYPTKSAADGRLRQLTPTVASKGKTVSLWNEETVFFADPF
jgi:hypothetical protein